MNGKFEDRVDAGRRLANCLRPLRFVAPLVLGLPRGGVPVAAEVAAALGAPFDVFVSAKVGTPGHEELGVGAVAEGLDQPVVSDTARQVGVSPEHLRRLAEPVRAELDRRVAAYRGDRPLPDMHGRDVVLVDDGLATGVTAEAALLSLRARGPRRLILAVPVCAGETAERLEHVADEVICAERPPDFFAVGQWYDNFDPTTDREVLDLLARGGHPPPTPHLEHVGARRDHRRT